MDTYKMRNGEILRVGNMSPLRTPTCPTGGRGDLRHKVREEG